MLENIFRKLYLVKNVGGKNMFVTRFRYIGHWVVIEHDSERKSCSLNKNQRNGMNALERKIE